MFSPFASSPRPIFRAMSSLVVGCLLAAMSVIVVLAG